MAAVYHFKLLGEYPPKAPSDCRGQFSRRKLGWLGNSAKNGRRWSSCLVLFGTIPATIKFRFPSAVTGDNLEVMLWRQQKALSKHDYCEIHIAFGRANAPSKTDRMHPTSYPHAKRIRVGVATGPYSFFRATPRK